MLHASGDPIAKLISESEQRVKDARHKPSTSEGVQVQRPELFDLEGAATACGLQDDDRFTEMLATINTWETTLNATKTRPRSAGEGDWRPVFLSALQTLLRETLYTKDSAHRKEHMYRVYSWYTEKMLHLERSEGTKKKSDPVGAAPVMKFGFGSSSRRPLSPEMQPVMSEELSSNFLQTEEAEASSTVTVTAPAEDRAARAKSELARYKTRDLSASYRRRLQSKGVLPSADAKAWHRPGAAVYRISEGARAVYGAPGEDSLEQADATHAGFHNRYKWAHPSFDALSAPQQRAVLQSAQPEPSSSDKLHSVHEAVVNRGMGPVAAAQALAMASQVSGTEVTDTNVPVTRVRPQTAPVVRRQDPSTEQCKAKLGFSQYVPSDHPKELLMHRTYIANQHARSLKHAKAIEMTAALNDWSAARTRVEEEISRREQAVAWEPRGGLPRGAEPRELDVFGEDSGSSEDDDYYQEITEDQEDADFAPGVETMASDPSRPSTAKIDHTAPASAAPKKLRPKSRGAVWLSSYHSESFHRIEYSKPKTIAKPPAPHRPMYVQRPESAIRLSGQDPKLIVTRAAEPTRPMSSLPTKARPMSATEYRKRLVKQYGSQATQLSEDGTAAVIPVPSPDPEWERDQTSFHTAQVAQIVEVREAFAKRGQRMPMNTIERALTLPKERTFEECMSAMQTATYMLKKDPNAPAKKKKKKKKKK